MSGAAAPAHRREAWIAGLALAAFASGSHALTQRGGILHGLSDEALLVPLARRAWIDGYAADAWLALAADVFSRAWSELFGAVLLAIDDPVAASRALSFPLQALFFSATWFLIRGRASRGAAWGGTIALLLAPPLLAGLAGATVAGPLAPGAALPRDAVFAVLPIWWLACADERPGSPAWWRIASFAGLGVMSVFHPLTAVHAVLLFAAVRLAAAPSGARLGETALCCVAGAAGAVQYVIQWTRFPRTPGAVPREALLERIGGIGADSPSLWMGRMEVPLLLGAAALVLGRGRAGPSRRTLRLTVVLALALAALAPLCNAVVPGIQLDRLTRVALWASIVLAAVELPAAWAARDRRALVLGALCVGAALGGRTAVRAASGQDRGPLELLVRRAAQRLGAETGAFERTASRERPGEPSADPALRDAFLAVAHWSREHTPRDALFAVPPEDWGAFRAYAVRSVVVTRKEGGFAMTFLGGRGNDWLAQYREAVEVYAAADPSRWRAAADRDGFAYAVLDGPAPLPGDWTEAFAAGPYRVVRTHVR